MGKIKGIDLICALDATWSVCLCSDLWTYYIYLSSCAKERKASLHFLH